MKASNAARASAFVSAIQISCKFAFGLRLLALRQLGDHVRRLVQPAALLARSRPEA
jgi:hypothetical protein